MENKNINVIDYHCLDCFIETVMEDVVYSNKFVTADIIAKRDMAQAIIRELVMCEDDEGNQFDIGTIDLDDEDYDAEFVISIDTAMNLHCDKMYEDNAYYSGYMPIENDYTYIHSDYSFKLMKNIGSECVVVFGFQGIDD